MPQDDSLGANVGSSPSNEDGEFVRDEELLTGQADPGFQVDSQRASVPRLSRRVWRSSQLGNGQQSMLGGRYQVERVISRTAYEVVVQALHLELAQRVIVRYLTPHASASSEAVARFQRGVRKAREMRSEHSERVVDFGRLETGCPYRASELPDGPSLSEILRVRGPLPVSEAVDIVLAASEPVAEAHAAGLVHRSLSLSNIYMERRPDGSPLVRVLDFGVSDTLETEWSNGEDLTMSGAVTMTDSLPYASPEQVRSPAAVDGRADVWALGAILYELLAGGPAFDAENALSLLAMIAADSPTPLNMLRGDIPPELEAIVHGSLEKDPDARPRSIVDLVLSLSPFASPEAQAAAARVTRIVTRATRPPPYPPGMAFPGPRGARSSVLVRSRPPRTVPASAKPAEAPSRNVGMLLASAGIGTAAAVITALLTRPAAPPAPEAAARALVTAAPVVATAAPVLLAPVAAPTLTATAVTTEAAPLAPAPRAPAPLLPPPAEPARAVAQRPAETTRPLASEPRTAPATPRAQKSPAASDTRAVDKQPTATADAKDLFSGLE